MSGRGGVARAAGTVLWGWLPACRFWTVQAPGVSPTLSDTCSSLQPKTSQRARSVAPVSRPARAYPAMPAPTCASLVWLSQRAAVPPLTCSTN